MGMATVNWIKWAAVLALTTALCACGKGSHEHLADARQALAASSFPEALASAEAGLQGNPDEVTTWGLELVILEAHARAGDGTATKAQLESLAGQYAARLKSTDYSGTAQLLQASGEKAVAIEVLDLGIKRFPDDALLAQMIEESKATSNDPAELEMLRSLGYIE